MPVVVGCAVEKTNELIKAVVNGIVLVLEATMPFAKQRRRVAIFFEHSWQRCNRRWNSVLWFTIADNDVDDACSLLVSTGEECGAGGAAHRRIGVEVSE